MNRAFAIVAIGSVVGIMGMQADHAEAGPVVYNDFYNHFNSASSLVKDGQAASDDVASWAYAANSADAFGGVIGFNKNTNELATFSTIMSNWDGWDPDGGSGTATPDYETSLTLELYKVDRSGSEPAPGDLLVEDTEMHTIEGREIPDASNASFADNGGTDFIVDWDLEGLNVGSEVLFMVRVDGLVDNTSSNPALNSLNIAAIVTDTSPDVTAGTDTDPGVYWRSETTGGEISRFESGQVLARATAVPEPASVALMGLGGVALLARRRRV